MAEKTIGILLCGGGVRSIFSAEAIVPVIETAIKNGYRLRFIAGSSSGAINAAKVVECLELGTSVRELPVTWHQWIHSRNDICYPKKEKIVLSAIAGFIKKVFQDIADFRIAKDWRKKLYVSVLVLYHISSIPFLFVRKSLIAWYEDTRKKCHNVKQSRGIKATGVALEHLSYNFLFIQFFIRTFQAFIYAINTPGFYTNQPLQRIIGQLNCKTIVESPIRFAIQVTNMNLRRTEIRFNNEFTDKPAELGKIIDATTRYPFFFGPFELEKMVYYDGGNLTFELMNLLLMARCSKNFIFYNHPEDIGEQPQLDDEKFRDFIPPDIHDPVQWAMIHIQGFEEGVLRSVAQLDNVHVVRPDKIPSSVGLVDFEKPELRTLAREGMRVGRIVARQAFEH